MEQTDDRTRRTDPQPHILETPRRPEGATEPQRRPDESTRARPGRQRPRRGDRDRWFGADESQSIAFYGEFYR